MTCEVLQENVVRLFAEFFFCEKQEFCFVLEGHAVLCSSSKLQISLNPCNLSRRIRIYVVDSNPIELSKAF